MSEATERTDAQALYCRRCELASLNLKDQGRSGVCLFQVYISTTGTCKHVHTTCSTHLQKSGKKQQSTL